MMGNCDSCKNQYKCRKDIGYIWGYCNTDYEPIADVVFTITTFCGDFNVCKMTAGSPVKKYLKSTRSGKDVWVSDYLYAKRYRYQTAKKHLLRLRNETDHSAAVLCGETI